MYWSTNLCEFQKPRILKFYFALFLQRLPKWLFENLAYFLPQERMNWRHITLMDVVVCQQLEGPPRCLLHTMTSIHSLVRQSIRLVTFLFHVAIDKFGDLKKEVFIRSVLRSISLCCSYFDFLLYSHSHTLNLLLVSGHTTSLMESYYIAYAVSAYFSSTLLFVS